jgi:hypothetical protein
MMITPVVYFNLIPPSVFRSGITLPRLCATLSSPGLNHSPHDELPCPSTLDTCVYNVNYHIVWSVKYRRKVLTAERECYLKDPFQEIAQEKEFEVVRMEVGEQDHIHVFATAHPKIAPSYIVKMLKGISAVNCF